MALEAWAVAVGLETSEGIKKSHQKKNMREDRKRSVKDYQVSGLAKWQDRWSFYLI